MELRDDLHGLMKVLRVLKQQRHPVLPSGTVGLMQAIDRGGRLKDVAAACALDQSTTSRAVAAAERAGLVHRVADPHDGRASLLELTEAGRATLADAVLWYDALLAAALRDWSDEDVERFGTYLRRFATALHDSHSHVQDHVQYTEAAR